MWEKKTNRNITMNWVIKNWQERRSWEGTTRSCAGAGKGAGRDPACQGFAVRHSEDSRKGQTAQDFLQMTRQTPNFPQPFEVEPLAALTCHAERFSYSFIQASMRSSASAQPLQLWCRREEIFSHFERAKDTILNNCFRSRGIHLKAEENISGNISNKDQRWRNSSIRTCLLLPSKVKKRSELALKEEIMQHSIPLPINTVTHES